MKGVILGLNPRVQVVDVTHAIAPGDIQAGAFALAESYALFPKGTIHVAVVDPGVGSARNAIVAQTSKYIFVGPDNAVLSLALDREKTRRIHRLENRHYFRNGVSNTFHGRDVFAPVAAHISRGVPLSQFGPGTRDFVKLNLPKPRRTRKTIEGEVVYIDRFGNAITNIHSEWLENWPGESIQVTAGNLRILTLSRFYSETKQGSPVALINSAGRLEIALNRGHAARDLRLKIGSPIVVRFTGT